MIRSMEEIRRTQTKTEMVWNTTEDSQTEVALEWELKRIEKMVSAINERLYVDNFAAKNQY
jgi:hypothetical protein